jgi:hypothetical protein
MVITISDQCGSDGARRTRSTGRALGARSFGSEIRVVEML